MDYSRFYTPPEIADLLIMEIDIEPPESIIDICCGSCNLLHATKKKWPRAELLGVDIVNHSEADIHCVQSDGRKYAIEHINQYPLVLANPPFAFVEKKGEFLALYQELPPQYTTSRLEIEMLLANLLLLDKQGTLLVIMPSTFVEAQIHKKIRILLAMKYHIRKIIHLPVETFGAARINSYALIIQNKISKHHYTRFHSVAFENGKYAISKGTHLSQKLIRSGEWDIAYTQTNELNKFDFRRGNISSQFFKPVGIPILHTAKTQDSWYPSTRYISEIPTHPVYAENGDVIISRVGKSAGQWTIHQGKKTLISDCLYCLKDPQGVIAQKLKGEQYSHVIKGVATQYITMKDFLSWYQAL